ncbi:plastocyanin/azurin family copper-binding protein [Coralliovum pocilloporae]|uniref:plastocyanin/azurin family copper-binding protein n=1 Tax=Coralliovum pocilloporae TaxID=3066369 RepID=UPI003307A728
MIKTTLSALCVALSLGLGAAFAAEPQHEVKQVIDLQATSSLHAFRFEPSYLRIAKGEVVRFTGSTGRHTVSSIPGMIPDGAKPFEIRGKPVMDLAFDVEGVYGVRCRVHGRHGMVMLLVVGEDRANLPTARERVKRVKPAEQVQFIDLFKKLDE